MDKKKLYESIMSEVSKELKKTLNESNVVESKRILKYLKSAMIYKNVELTEPIYDMVTYSKWYRNFILSGGGVIVEKHMGAVLHTFVCNTVQAQQMAEKFIFMVVPDYFPVD